LKFTARATVNFNLAIKEIRNLLDYYSGLSENQNNINLEVFKRSSVILMVTAWESFVEDMLGLHINYRLNDAKSPNDISKAFNTVANSWYMAILNKYDNHPKPEDFTKWTGDNWKELIREKLREDLISLNTPKSKNISSLSKRYLGVDITQEWNMPRITAQQASRKLDQLIEMRGEITHRIVNYFEARSSIGQGNLVGNVNFVEQLAKRTENVLDSI
jgi:RiboL-PSP-HEPN